MSRPASYLGIFIAIALGVIVGSISNSVTVVHSPIVLSNSSTSTNATTASSTISTLSDSKQLPIQTKTAEKTETTTESVPAVKTPPPAAPVSAPTVVALTSAERVALDTSASALRAALVNIICYTPAGSSLHSILGSGIFVDPKGIILTNAHIAQNFLLADRNVTCVIRTGSPATDRYKASLIYISPKWIQVNAKILTQESPIGTGEYDFAFLAITESVTSLPLSSSFPFVQLAVNPLMTGAPVVIASYGAQFLETSQIQYSLFPTVVFGSVKDIFTFATNTIDVLALGGSAAAQEGSSGGGVSDKNGELVGTITTSTVKGSTDTRKLDAITASYIRAEYANETGNALDLLLAKPTSISVSEFAPQIPAFESILTSNLQ